MNSSEAAHDNSPPSPSTPPTPFAPDVAEATPFGASLPTPLISETEVERHQLSQQVRSGAHWFYWIVGLSLINSLFNLAKLDFGFAIGLGATIVLDVLAAQSEGAVKAIVFAANLIPLGFYTLIGAIASRFRSARTAFVVGGLFYLVDSFIFIAARDWIGILIHAYVLFVLFKSFVAAGRLKRLPEPGLPSSDSTIVEENKIGTSASSFDL